MAVVFHIGLPKTATTFLQQRLFSAHPEIRNLGMPALTFERRRCIRSVLEAERSTCLANLDWLKARVALGDGQRVAVLSEERFCLGPHWPGNPDLFVSRPNDREEIADRLYQISPSARILITVREQLSLIESFYLQQRKVSLFNKDFEPWLQECWDNLYVLSPFHAFRYDQLAEIYAARFGRDRIHILDYRTFLNDRAHFSRRLAEVLGLRSDDIVSYLRDTTPLNSRARQGTLMLDHALRRFRILERLAESVPGFIKRPMRATLGRLGRKQKAELSPAWRDRLRAFYAEGNARFADEYGVSF